MLCITEFVQEFEARVLCGEARYLKGSGQATPTVQHCASLGKVGQGSDGF